MPPSNRYIHGSAPTEQRRLSRLNELLNQATLRELDLQGGESILDVGSGIGQLTRAMARRVGTGGTSWGSNAILISLPRRGGRRGLTRKRTLSSSGKGMRLLFRYVTTEWGSFDVAHSRFLLEHVSDPLGVVRELVRAVRPGGRIVLADDDHDVLRLWPEPPGFMRSGRRIFVAMTAWVTTHTSAGAWLGFCMPPERYQPATTGSFSEAVRECLLSPISLRTCESILVGARMPILSTAHIEEDAFDHAIEALMSWGTRPDAAFWFAMCWAEGTRK